MEIVFTKSNLFFFLFVKYINLSLMISLLFPPENLFFYHNYKEKRLYSFHFCYHTLHLQLTTLHPTSE